MADKEQNEEIEKVDFSSLDALEKQIADYPNENKLPRSKHIVIKLAQSTKLIDMCVLSNTMIGLTGAHHKTAKEEKPFRIQKFKAHIEELSKNPNAQIVLGGDLFYYPQGSKKYREEYAPSYDQQVALMTELLEPVKDKIIGAYDGTEEIKTFEKDGINLTKKLMDKLGIADRYCGQMAEIDFVFNNEMTNGTNQTVHMLFDHGFLAANVTGTVTKKTEGLQKKINGKDFYFTSHYNKLCVERRARLIAEKGTRMVKKPFYFVSVGGYRDYPNRLTSNRNVSAANTDNGMTRIYVVPNPDKGNVRGHDYVGEPAYKICQETKNFGRTPGSELNFNIIKETAKVQAENAYAKIALLSEIEKGFDKLEKDNIDTVLKKYYDKKEERKAAVPVHQKQLVTNTTPMIILLDDEEDDL